MNVSWTFAGNLSEIEKFQILSIRFDNNQRNENFINDRKWIIIENCFPGFTYTMIIKTMQNYLLSEPDNLTVTTEPLPPSALTIVNHTYSSIFITWISPENSTFDGFVVKIREIGSLSWHDLEPKTINNYYNIEKIYPKSYAIRVASVSNGKQSSNFESFNEARLSNQEIYSGIIKKYDQF